MSITGQDVLEDLRYVVDDVWEALTGEGLDEVGDLPAGPTWSGAVSITGPWQGTVTVSLGASAATALTTRMLALPADEPPAEADVADAVGELVNMVGGSVKSLMPGPGVLSLPLVAAGRPAYSSEAVALARLDRAWHGAPVVFTVTTPH